MKKRIVSVLLVMAMCVSMSACGSKGAEKKSDGSASGQKKVAVVYLSLIHIYKECTRRYHKWEQKRS